MSLFKNYLHLVSAFAAALVVACGGGGSDGGGGIIDPNNPPGGSASAPLFLTLDCPVNATPGAKVVGFKATVTDKSPTDPNAKTLTGVLVSVSPTEGVASVPTDNDASTSAKTNTRGEVDFAFTAPASAKVGSTITITAVGSITVNGTKFRGEDVCDVTLTASSFKMTKPVANSAHFVGQTSDSNGPKVVNVLWQAQGGVGISGPVKVVAAGPIKLALTQGGTASGSGGIVLNTNSNGTFSNPPFFSCTAAGVGEITAIDNSSADTLSKDTVSVQCLDTPGSGVLNINPLQVSPAPASGRYSELEFTVFNTSNQPMPNQAVEFTMTGGQGPAGANDRLLVPGGVTDKFGKVLSRFEAGSTTAQHTVQIRATVVDSSPVVSDVRSVTVLAPAP